MFNLKVKRWAYLILGGVSCFYRINLCCFLFFFYLCRGESFCFVKSKTGLC